MLWDYILKVVSRLAPGRAGGKADNTRLHYVQQRLSDENSKYFQYLFETETVELT